ncbi:AMP-binding protein [Thiomicrorhabdus heinhorstiae]|uniref:AMP-binding protein n=1 Tax=Thiomicrorhabdus heinhorstiae TaxID=2748010 RepID=A0ABS0C0G4_9GAMM|nr:AMP-binding protein [Thiomicrorhabdus heinhorstiae]MBF6057736.1 AMP-binding protein [Thiomicrorhabdus heinhorstiae]
MKWLIKSVVRFLLKLLYRVEVKGLENYYAVDQSQKPMLIIANHVSLLDGPLLELFIPGETTFMVDKGHTKKSTERFILGMSHYFTVDIHSPYAAKHMIDELKKGKQCMIFPEGRITTTGGLMKVYEGTGLVAAKTGAAILPVHIAGAVYSKFSYLDGTKFAFMKSFFFPKITISIQPAETIQSPKGMKGHDKHLFFKREIFRMLRDGAFYANSEPKPLFRALLDSERQFHAKEICVEDINDQTLTLKKIRLASSILGKALQKQLQDEQRVGLMLPNVAGMPATFFALQAYGYVPAMINFTAGINAIGSACKTAELKTVITSKRFVDAFELQPLIDALQDEVRFIFLEDVRETIGAFAKLGGLLRSVRSLPGNKVDPEADAVVLFTSGSEGVPKGVVLSHRNIVSNIEQISAMLTLLPGEQLFNALPTFHCFGLTAGMLWPILKGARVYMYPSPVHYGIVPEMVYQTNSRLIFGTDTFYTGYARKADPYDFYSLRALVAGAERLRPETRQLYADKYHQPIFEGYGVTETTPVLSVNIPIAYKNGSVGQFVPAVEHRLEPIPGISEGGRLFVKGPNIMKGYLMADKPGVLQPPVDGWHDTGDIVDVDEDGYVWIKGRAKRFAKIGGEMVSLTAVETYINEASPEGHHVVVAVPDKRKGEQLVLVTDDGSLSRNTVTEAARNGGFSELMIPKTVILVEAVPILGTGKTNYPEVQKIAERHFNE